MDPSPYLTPLMRKGFLCWSPRLLRNTTKRTWMMMSSWQKWVSLNLPWWGIIASYWSDSLALWQWWLGPCRTAESAISVGPVALCVLWSCISEQPLFCPDWCPRSFRSRMFGLFLNFCTVAVTIRALVCTVAITTTLLCILISGSAHLPCWLYIFQNHPGYFFAYIFI